MDGGFVSDFLVGIWDFFAISYNKPSLTHWGRSGFDRVM
jgi:hypothetical protein